MSEEAKGSVEQAEQIFRELKGLHANATAKVQEIDQFFTQFEGLRNKINDDGNGVEKTMEVISDNENAIQTIKTEAEQKLTEIETFRTNATAKVQEIDQFFTQFEGLRNKVLDPEVGIEAVLNKIETFEKKAVTAKNSAEDEHNQTVKLKSKTQAALGEADAANGDIKDLLKDSEELKLNIQKHLELVSDSARSDAFLQRKKDLEKEVKFWKWSLIVGLAVLAVLFGGIYLYQMKNGGFSNWHDLYRYIFTIPVAYFVTLASKNYSEARLYLEKYSFKAITSVTLEAYVKIMRDKFPDYKKELFDFLRETIHAIYTEPYTNKKTRRTINLNFKPNFGITAQQEDEDVQREMGGLDSSATKKE